MSLPDTSLFVVATTPEGTRGALCHAGRLSGGRRRIVLLVPVPYKPDASLLSATLIEEYTRVAATAGVAASAYGLVCKNPADIFLYFPVGPDATVIVGAVQQETAREEAQLVDTLRAMGHEVLFVSADNGESAPPATDVA